MFLIAPAGHEAHHHGDISMPLAQAEQALRLTEARYRTLFEAFDEGFCVFDMIFDEHGQPVDYRFTEVNPAFERHTGLKDAVGKTIREMVPNHEQALARHLWPRGANR